MMTDCELLNQDEGEIIDVPCADFWARKDTVSLESIDQKIRNKIETMLQSFDCFTKDIMFFAPASNNHHGNGGHQQSHHHRFHNRHREQRSHGGGAFRRGAHLSDRDNVRPARLTNLQSNPLKEVCGLLNKITATTYHVLVQKVIRCCAYKGCAQEVIEVILKKCYIHGTYSYLYHNLLHEMYHRYQGEVKEATNRFVQGFLCELKSELVDLQYQPSAIANYEAYCLYMKRKTSLLDKLKNIIVINRKYHGLPTLNEEIFNIVYSNLQNVIRSRDPELFDFLDILSTLFSIMKKEKVIPHKMIDDLVFIYNDIRDAYPVELPKKIQFCWEKIIGEL